MNFCKDCTSFQHKRPEWTIVPVCTHPSVSPPDPVWGEPAYVYCAYARSVKGSCMPNGHYFRLKNEDSTIK